MFRSTMIAKFHHLYLIQALIEIQRHWQVLYSKLKHRVAFVIDKRLRSNLIKSLRGKITSKHGRIYGQEASRNQSYEFVGAGQRNVFQDLNTILASPGHQEQPGSVSVPMQIFMMPMLVQPCSMGSPGNHYAEQQHPTPVQGHYVTMVPGQMVVPSHLQPQLSNADVYLGGREDMSNSLNPSLEEFVSAQKRRSQSIPTPINDRTCVRRSTYKSNWSSIDDRHRSSALTVRNLLIS